MEDEVWKKIEGAASYSVSSKGRVRCDGKTKLTTNGQNRFYQPKICGHSTNQYGHLKVRISYDDGSWKNAYIHHLVASAFIGERPEGLRVLHGEEGKLVNEPHNLRYGTDEENSADKIRDGTHAAGEAHPSSVLTWDIVREIRCYVHQGFRVKDLAAKFGVSRQTITGIKVGRTWVE